MKKRILTKSVVLALALALLLCFTLSACGKQDDTREYFSEETTYYYTHGEAVGMEIDGYLDLETSFIKFYPNGKMILQIDPNVVVISIAAIYLNANRNDLAGISLSDMQRYTSEVLPGESFFALLSALVKLSNSLGVNIKGIDFEDEDVQAFFAEFEETHTIPKFTAPTDIALTIEANYGLCEIPTDFSEEPYRAIYLGDYDSADADPFFLLTRYVTDDGKEALFLCNEMLSMQIDFAMK